MVEFKNKKWFTIVELIVVITILAILWTIWFVSYSNFTTDARDTNRIQQIKWIYDWLDVYTKDKRLPLPENMVTIYASWTVIAYQGYAWKNVLSLIWYEKWWLDPKDNIYYTYVTDKKRKSIKVLAFLESENNKQVFIPKANAKDYKKRIPYVKWKKLFILTESWTNSPIQENINLINWWLDIVTTTGSYNAYFTTKSVVSWSWSQLSIIKQVIENPNQSCFTILKSWLWSKDWIYTINPLEWTTYDAYCDMTTNWWWWTLVFVAKWAVPPKYINPLWFVDWTSNYATWKILTWWWIDSFENKLIDRSDLSSQTFWTNRYMTLKLKEVWPYYTEIYRERWLPATLTWRESYAAPWFKKNLSVKYANISSPTNMNYLSNKREQSQWWDWAMKWGATDWNVYHWPSRITTPSWEKIYYYSCRWCITWYLMWNWWQWNWFFPDITYNYWRITNSTNYNVQWTEYNNLLTGTTMPWYWLYVR